MLFFKEKGCKDKGLSCYFHIFKVSAIRYKKRNYITY